LPQRVILRCPLGILESDGKKGQGTLEVALKGGLVRALISFPGLADSGKEPLPIEVTSVDQPETVLGATSVELVSQGSMDVDKLPETLVADGQSSGTSSITVKDQYMRPLEGLPCVVVYSLPFRASEAVVVWTNEKGIATFQTPSVTRAGKASFQVQTDQLASDQMIVTYTVPPTG
jgi:hypothetical protein